MSAAVVWGDPKKIKIDDEFRGLLPELRPEEFASLEENIVREGCRDPLVVWRMADGTLILILIEGHHRFAICKRHGLPFQIKILRFQSREQVKDWIVENQLGRRNLTKSWSKYYLGCRYEAQKAQGVRTSPQNGEKLTTAEKLAKQYNLGKNTVERAGEFSRAIDRIAKVEHAGPALRAAILAEKIKRNLTHEDVIELAERPDVARKAFERAGNPPSFKGGDIRQLLREAKRLDKFGDLIRRGTPPPGEDWGRFSVLLADPPWNFQKDHGPTAENTFPTMNLDEIAKIREALDLDTHVTDDCVLFLWATAVKLPAAMELMARWNFEYKGQLIWAKPHQVIGSLALWQHEILLVGMRGSLPPLHRPRSIFEGEPWRPRLHSAKPDHAYEIVEAMYPGLSKLELFARRYRAGWTSWGNELGRYEDEDEPDAA